MGSLRVRPQESALLQPEGCVPTIPFTLTIGESEREHFAVMLAAQLAQRGALVVDYVRLNILAKREVAA